MENITDQAIKTSDLPFYLAPASSPRDQHAAGYDGNGFATREEAEAAIPGLRGCGEEYDVEWVVGVRS